MILAPLRGVTIRSFRETFTHELSEVGFTEAITPFITANPGFDPLKDRELAPPHDDTILRITPQFIGKDPAALRHCLLRIKSTGYETADLNAGCPYPMVRNKGRGSGLLATPDVLRQLLDVGCSVMGENHFSVKTRLGIARPNELEAMMPLLNAFPLRFLTVHARTARQMYEGTCDYAAFARVRNLAKMPLIYNGDAPLDAGDDVMVGRAFVRALGERENARELLLRYIDHSSRELSGDRPVLGRIKELVAYWKDIPAWHARWNIIKLARTLAELRRAI